MFKYFKSPGGFSMSKQNHNHTLPHQTIEEKHPTTHAEHANECGHHHEHGDCEHEHHHEI